MTTNPGDDTVVFASMFASSASLASAWLAMRRPGPLRVAVEQRLILAEFVAGEGINLFALTSDPNLSWTDATTPIPAW